MKNKILPVLVLLSTAFSGLKASAQSHISTQAHESSVNALAAIDGVAGEQDTVFSVGQDGFIIKWTDDGLGEHYQVTDVAIKMAARSPNGRDIAIYESDGASLNMVSIWNFSTLTRKCAFTFSTPITSLSYSAKGTYVLCGTASERGTYFLTTSNNTITSRKLKESTGPVSMAVTSDSENSAAMYSPGGSLSYYNLRTGQKKAKFYTESGLSQPRLYNNNVFLAGYKDSSIYIIQATTGSTIAKFPVSGKEPVLLSSNKSDSLYYIVSENLQFKMYMIQNDRNKNVIAPQLIRTFTGIRSGEEIGCAVLQADGTVFAGTTLGNIYKFDNAVAARVDVLQPVSDKMYDKIYDVAPIGSNFYFLSPDSVFLSSYDSGIVDRKGSNPGQTNIITYNDNAAILWSRGTRKAVQLLEFQTGALTTLFTPDSTLQSLRLFGGYLLSIEGSSTVSRINIQTNEKENLYNGAGIQDAVLYNDTDLYIAKTSATTPEVPLLYINTRTKETVPLSLKGSVAYSLSYDPSAEGSEIYGIVISTNSQNSVSTAVFSYNPSTKTSRRLIEERSEDSNAISYLSYPVLYTNMGKSRIRSYNLSARRSFEYKRSASLPVKIARNSSRLVVLNRDGSVSWYNPDMNGVIADWYLTTDGQWFEF